MELARLAGNALAEDAGFFVDEDAHGKAFVEVVARTPDDQILMTKSETNSKFKKANAQNLEFIPFMPYAFRLCGSPFHSVIEAKRSERNLKTIAATEVLDFDHSDFEFVSDLVIRIWSLSSIWSLGFDYLD